MHKKYILFLFIIFSFFSNVSAFSFTDFFYKIGFSTKEVKQSPEQKTVKTEIKIITLPDNYEKENTDIIKNYYTSEIEKKEIITTGSTTFNIATMTATGSKSFQDILTNLRNFLSSISFGSSNYRPNSTTTTQITNTSTLGGGQSGTGANTGTAGSPSSSGSGSSGQGQTGSQQDPFQNLMSGNGSGQSPLQQILGQNGGIGQVTAGQEQNAGQIQGGRGDIGQGAASSFAHDTMSRGCIADADDQQNNQRSASGQILSRVNVPAIPAVALRISGRWGDAVEVKDLSTGNCKAFPLLDFGPAPCKVDGSCAPNKVPTPIDLTGSAIDILQGRQPCKNVSGVIKPTFSGIPKVQYALVPGEKIQPGQVKDCKHLK
jgi:hypothetical protein